MPTTSRTTTRPIHVGTGPTARARYSDDDGCEESPAMAHNLALTIKPRSLATVDEGSAVDAIQEAADAASICRDISLLHNVINQLAVESQSLLNTFQLYLRANQSASATTATPVSASSVSTAKDSAISTTSPTSRPLNTLSTISSCTGTLTGSQKLRVDNVTATSALALSDPPTLPVLQATLREQWDAIKLLCYTLDGTVGSYQSEISPYVFAMGSIIDALTGLSASPTQQQPQQQPQPLKPMAAGASEYNLPFYSLKLLSAIKSAVAVEVDLLERVVTEEQMKAATSVVDGASVALQNRLAKLMRRRGEVGASGGPGGLLGVDDADASPRNRTAGGGDDDDELARSMDDFEGSTPSSQGTGGSASAVSASPAMLALPGSAASFRIRSVSDGVKPSEEQALHPHDRDRLLSVAPEGDAGEKHDTVGGPTLAATGGAGVDGAGIRYTVRSIARQIVVVTARPPAPGASLRDARRGFLTQVSGQPASLPAISSTANSPTAMTSPTSAAAAGDTGSPIRRSRSLTSTNRDRVSSIRASRADGAAWGRATPSPTGGVSGSPSVSQNANTFNGGGGGSPFLAGGGGSASMQRQTSSSAFGVVTSPPPMTLQALAGTLDALLPLTAAKEQQQQQHQQAQPQQARKPFMSPASHQPSPTSDASSATTIRKISPLSPGMRSVSATTQVVLIPINGMFELCTLDLKGPTSFGRSNTRKNINFKAFESQVVSRNHMEIWEDGGKVYIRDMGSNGGTYRNGSRLSPSGQASAPVEVQTGDYVQIGRDFLAQTEDGNIVKVSEDEIVNGLDPSLSFNLHWKNELPDGGVTVVDSKHNVTF
ncbi:hypothetical protein HK101_008207 [Irineochytrium annulatum]|nr:hypothetical protein HK101_008207 [Irineochytrium annulatum]